MKLALVGVVLLTTGFAMYCSESNAGNRHPLTGASANAGAIGVGVGLGVGLGGDGGSVGNTSVANTIEAGDYSDLRIVPPAIAPNVTNTVICPIVTQGSKAGSVFFFSGSAQLAQTLTPFV